MCLLDRSEINLFQTHIPVRGHSSSKLLMIKRAGGGGVFISTRCKTGPETSQIQIRKIEEN